MSRVILVTGGSRSGKSSYAENIFKERDDVLYIATAVVTDQEMKNRIDKHKKSRNQRWKTYEGYKDLHRAIENIEEPNILLDCVTIMVTNLLFDKEIDFDNISMEEVDNIQDNIKSEFEKLIFMAKEKNKTLVMVTNEVGSGLIPEYKLSRIYRDIAGFINQFIAKLSDEVYLVTCGLPLKLK
ncbi:MULTISPECIES: bifunctional adenosylcobinamide kinase/adenosylcobinamide-phosphate guanylyltransferase [Clostridium]|uniref:Adenosylcobinamide kinase n=1 Tax=Clostridium faecium TaxID=2762223 RepID=A0ABR8YRS9_9CLOT|nr:MULTISPECIES: bifunctional adenosylcobinamide kinase/adenosylcobinamide-phosphate guanylyltransferase [Clostridium]MBD8046584.1 bifunctional adenosylcobinamide kinase/adenosylcobinamide-phosphate guanylyltransferase [Clostridium faecium]MDU1350050.1 bifunctional adenosylcobinamide kinase/adenosylcobinamide-phosphate guanylyltransferase [Clostridium argentinense]